ncbi:hypothetical protein F2Q68_00014505 [Brassica cretica]|uniref:Uncharacterized protein n=1 Tax=Brassica cretica TaxID=69181 RepID=A0A8S9HK62_BRACR|nr:hypothetical protein F2Q68_00014505 [Brassica cretica]
MNTPQVVSELRLIDSWSPRLEEERHMKKLPSETEETRKVKEIFGLQEKKKNCWALFAAAEQVYGGRIHESVESVEMISSYEIIFSLEFSKGASICYYSQGVCDSHKVCVTICIGVSDVFIFSEGFHGVHGLNLHGISVAGGVLIYVGISARWYSLVSVKGVAEGLKKIDSCGSVSHGILGARGRLRTLNDMSVSWLFQMVFFSQREGCCRRVEEDRLMRFFAGMDLRERGVTCSRQSSAEQAYERKQMGLQGITVAEDLLATTAVQSDVQGKVLIQIVTKEILRMRSLVSTGY